MLRNRIQSRAKALKIISRALRPAIESLEKRILLTNVSWDGGGDGTTWRDRLNWSNDAVPTINDDVVIDSGLSPFVRISGGNQSVNSLTTNEILQVGSGGNLSVASTATIGKDLLLSG